MQATNALRTYQGEKLGMERSMINSNGARKSVLRTASNQSSFTSRGSKPRATLDAIEIYRMNDLYERGSI
ncbi:MAG: hypothetical protein NVS1B13_12690 [Flavisolibacter sp.]